MGVKKKTKIISTIGPASNSKGKIKELIIHGANVFRFNMKHGTVQWHEDTINMAQEVADKMGVPIGILIDLQGPEIRIGTKNGDDLAVTEGQEIYFGLDFSKKETSICVPHLSLFDALKKGDKFTIDDGFIRFVVTESGKDWLKAGALDNAVIGDNKGLNLVGIDIALPSLIKDDIERLHLATKNKVDYVALSFVRTKEDILTLKKEMEKKNIDAQIVAKIESQKGLDNIDEIIKQADAIMIARGDLGIEVPIEQITYHQKEIIKKCRRANKPVIVATQMLQSMIEFPIPTRAEATDVANAVFDGTDAVMLSGETATGKYPIKSVEAMGRILEFNETKADVTYFDTDTHNATELIVEAAEIISMHSKNGVLNISKIIVFTDTGYTAKIVASFRSKIPVIAVTSSRKTVETLTLSYGISPVQVDFPKSGKVLSPEKVLAELKAKRLVKKGENVLLIHGQHWKTPGQTNAIVLITVD